MLDGSLSSCKEQTFLLNKNLYLLTIQNIYTKASFNSSYTTLMYDCIGVCVCVCICKSPFIHFMTIEKLRTVKMHVNKFILVGTKLAYCMRS